VFVLRFTTRRSFSDANRIGSPILFVPPERIAGIVETNLTDEFNPLASDDSKSATIGRPP